MTIHRPILIYLLLTLLDVITASDIGTTLLKFKKNAIRGIDPFGLTTLGVALDTNKHNRQLQNDDLMKTGQKLLNEHFKFYGRQKKDPNLPVSLPFDVQTWRWPQAPTVTLLPSKPITSKPKNVELVFNCEATGVPKPTIVWLHDGLPIENGKNNYRVYEVKAEGDHGDKTASKLTAQSTTRSGAITCQGVNKHGRYGKVINVKILGPGSPPSNIKPTINENGFTVEFEPPEIKNGPITKYIIYYAPEDTAGDLSKYSTKVIDGTGRSVTIDNQAENTPFVFRMQAASDDGPGILSETYKVKTGEKHIPLLVRLEISNPTRNEGKDTVVEPKQPITFRCIAEGRPKPIVSYSWLPLNNIESGGEPVTVATTPAPDAEYRYQTNDVTSSTSTPRKLLCQARNQDGTVADSSVFVVLKPGSPPKDITSDVGIDNRVTIKWKEPDYPNGEITGYNLYLVTNTDKPTNEWQIFDVPATDGEPKFEFGRGELKPDTLYYVKIAAKNADGEGIPSDPASFEAVSGAPIDAPTDIVVDIAEDNTLNISWSGPKQPNGPIEGYVVYFTPEDPEVKDEDYKSWPHVDVPTTEDTGFVSLDNDEHNIQPDTDYKTRISAKNDMNEGPASEPVTFKTGSGELPPVVTLKPDDNPFLVAPKANVAIKCTATGVPQPKVKWIVGDEERETPELRLTDVRKDITVTCIAVNNAGESQANVDVQVQGPGTPPNEVVALPLPNQEINVEWTAPDEPNGKIKEYIIHYGEIPEGANEPTERHTISVPGDGVNHKIPNVKPKTDYSIKVQAVSDRGPGVESDLVRVHTLPLAPTVPEAADVVVHDNNTVVIKFDAVPNPENITPNIKSCKIIYTPDDPTSGTTKWKELIWNHPDDFPEIAVPVDGENFIPEKKYTGRTSIQITWDPPHVQNNPVTYYTLYYTTNQQLPLKLWKKTDIIEPNRQVTLSDLQTNCTYYIRVRAADKLGPGKPSEAVSVNTLKPPAFPLIEIVDESEKLVAPNTSFSISCNVVQGDPTPTLHWIHKDRPITQHKTTRLFTIEHVGLIQDAVFICSATNEAGTDVKNVSILIAGPSIPEHVRCNVDGTSVQVFWEQPKYSNNELRDYEILYTKDPSLPINQWESKKVGDPAATTATVDDLDEETKYTFKIRAISDRGLGLVSLSFDVQTWLGSQVPTVTLTPSEPIFSTPKKVQLVFNCEVTGVPKPRIFWLHDRLPIEDSKNNYRIYEVEPESSDKTISKLIAQSATRSGVITCQGVNKHGQDEKIVEVKILGPGSPPSNITSTTNKSSFTVEFDPPEICNGPIKKYIIYYAIEDTAIALSNYFTKVIDGTDRFVTIDNQSENTSFVFRMQALSDDGPGIISEIHKVRTGEKMTLNT